MKVENATIRDVDDIHGLVTYYAELDRMLFRSKASIYENLQTFLVCRDGDSVIGCCALQVVWSDLAEIKSLAVAKEAAGRGVGRTLVANACEKAEKLGIERVFALTLEPGFFEKMGFSLVKKESLPMKVWSDCARCPKQDACDEFALVKQIG